MQIENNNFHGCDSSVFISFSKINKPEILLNVCDYRVVISERVALECANVLGFSLQQIGEPERCLDYNQLSTANFNLLYDPNFKPYSSITKDPKGIHINQFYIVSSFFSFNDSSYAGPLSSLSLPIKHAGEEELMNWCEQDPVNRPFLTNDAKAKKDAKRRGLIVSGTQGILVKAINNGWLEYFEAENIFYELKNIDKLSIQSHRDFQEIYNNRFHEMDTRFLLG